MTTMYFRRLSLSEEQEFRQHAQENDPENMASWELYHPVCREEWIKRGIHPWIYVDESPLPGDTKEVELW